MSKCKVIRCHISEASLFLSACGCDLERRMLSRSPASGNLKASVLILCRGEEARKIMQMFNFLPGKCAYALKLIPGWCILYCVANSTGACDVDYG